MQSQDYEPMSSTSKRLRYDAFSEKLTRRDSADYESTEILILGLHTKALRGRAMIGRNNSHIFNGSRGRIFVVKTKWGFKKIGVNRYVNLPSHISVIGRQLRYLAEILQLIFLQ